MKVGLVRRGYSSSGGAESYLQRFARALTAAGDECVLFSSQPWPDWPHQFFLVKGQSPRAFADALEAAQPREKCDWLFSLERVWRCDVYRAGDGLHRVALAQRARFEPGWRTWFRKFSGAHRELLEIEAALYSSGGARTVIANSQMVKDEIVRDFSFPAEKIAVIYNGLPAEKLSPPRADRAAARRALDLPDDKLIALFVGSGWERKGLRFAMEAVERLPHAMLLVAGRGKMRGLPSARRSKFLGPVRDLTPFFAAADVFVLPTVYEPFSNACLEAAAAGLPVITTKFNGFAEVMAKAGVSGLLDDPGDLESLSRIIKNLAEPSTRDGVGARLQRAAQEFSIERNLHATLALVGSNRD